MYRKDVGKVDPFTRNEVMKTWKKKVAWTSCTNELPERATWTSCKNEFRERVAWTSCTNELHERDIKIGYKNNLAVNGK